MLYEYAELGSTSDEAKSLASKATPLPFGVMADRQTSGRGRLGTSWSSPSGNLYLTLVFSGAGIPPEAIGALPLAVGIWICDAVQETYGLRLTLKWPNDLLFFGLKMGGILCESMVAGSDITFVLVGIGLNIETLPVGMAATALGQVLPAADLDAAVLGRHLFAHICRAWQQESIPAALRRYPQYGLEDGQEWLRSDGVTEVLSGLSPTGALRLGGRELSSVRHDFVWRFSGERHEALWVYDAGNTALKIAYFASARGDQEPTRLWSCDWSEDLGTFFKHLRPLPETLFGGSVNPEGFRAAVVAARAAGIKLVPIAKRPLRVKFRRETLASIGIDRLALLEAVAAEAPRRAVLAISLGTATTVDGLSAEGQHLGGLILPGLALQLQALHTGTGLLPDLEAALVPLEDGPLGFDTTSAMLKGQSYQLLALVQQLRQKFAIQGVFVAGGMAEAGAVFLDAEAFGPGVLLGLREMVLGGVCFK